MKIDDDVYLHYDQQSLDEQYNNRARFPNFVEHFDLWKQWSEATKQKLPGLLDVSFGPSPIERLDIFPAAENAPPILVFIHGGYWYSLDKSDYSYVAEGMRPHGVTTVVNNFGLAPDHDMDEIVRQNREAIAWLWRHAAENGANPNQIYVSGHSAGGHLAAMLLATDWQSFAPDLPQDLVKGACAIAGIFDLEPIRLSFLTNTLNLTPAQVRDYSPLRQALPSVAPLLLVVAKGESEEFHRQSQEMARYWTEIGNQCELLVPQDLDHFDVVNQLKDPGCELVDAQLRHMRIAFRSGSENLSRK